MEKLYYKEYYHLEREHWWFRARLQILEFILKKKILKKNPLKILNAGAATGATSIMLKKYGEVLSLEYDKACSAYLSEILKEEVSNSSLTDLPFNNKTYDLVCAFDVIEHIEDDNKAILEMNRVLNDNGYVFITVPSFRFLWGKHDEVNHHFRRYRIEELKDILKKNGFEVNYYSYFNFLLFVPILIIRLIAKIWPGKLKPKGTGSDFEKFNNNQLLNRLLFAVFQSETALLNKEMKLPFGVSAMIIGRKLYNMD